MNLIFAAYIFVIPFYLVYNLYSQKQTEFDMKRLNPLVTIDFLDQRSQRYLAFVVLFFITLYISINWIIHIPILIYFLFRYKDRFASPGFVIAVMQFYPIFRVIAIANFLLVFLLILYLNRAGFTVLGYSLFFLLVISNMSFLISFLFSSNKLVDQIKLSDRNIYFEFSFIALFAFLSIIASAFFIELKTYGVEFTFAGINGTVSNVLSYKKIRSYFWGYEKYIGLIDLFIALMGVLFASSIVKSFFKLKDFKRENTDHLMIAESLIAMGKYEKANSVLERISGKNKEENYYRFKAYANLGMKDFDKALASAKQALPRDDHYSLDHSYSYILSDCHLYMPDVDRDLLESFFIKWIEVVEHDVFLIRMLVFHIVFQNLDGSAIERIYSFANEDDKDFKYSGLIFDVIREDNISLLHDYQVSYPFEAIHLLEMQIGYLCEVELPEQINAGQDISNTVSDELKNMINELAEAAKYVESSYELEMTLKILLAYKIRINKYSSQFNEIIQDSVQKITMLDPELLTDIGSINDNSAKFINDVMDHHVKEYMSKSDDPDN